MQSLSSLIHKGEELALPDSLPMVLMLLPQDLDYPPARLDPSWEIVLVLYLKALKREREREKDYEYRVIIDKLLNCLNFKINFDIKLIALVFKFKYFYLFNRFKDVRKLQF